MSNNTNPKNITGSTVTVVGNAGGPVETFTFPSGGTQAQLSISVNKGYKDKSDKWVDTGVDWYTLTASEAYAEENWPNVQKGDKVRVDDGRLELKLYSKKTGEPGLEANIKFGTLIVVEAKSDRSSGGSSSYVDNTPF